MAHRAVKAILADVSLPNCFDLFSGKHQPLPKPEAGDDIQVTDKGKFFIQVNAAALGAVSRGQDFGNDGHQILGLLLSWKRCSSFSKGVKSRGLAILGLAGAGRCCPSHFPAHEVPRPNL